MALSSSSPLLRQEDVVREEGEKAGGMNGADTLHHVIIGFSDGVTVPFALTAGLSSLGSSRLVVIGGLADLFSGMISMGLGAYLAAVTERDRSRLESREEEEEEAAIVALDDQLCHLLCRRYLLSSDVARVWIHELGRNPVGWQRFCRDVLTRTDRRDPSSSSRRPCLAGLTMGASYLVGGLIPMLPYFFVARVGHALLLSVVITLLILLAFGYLKDYLAVRSHRAGCWGALQTLVIGILAAGTSYAIVRALDAAGEP